MAENIFPEPRKLKSESAQEKMGACPEQVTSFEQCCLELAQARACQERYSSIVNLISDGCFETDLNRSIVFCNQAILDMTGYCRQDVIGHDYRRFVSTETVALVEEMLDKVLDGGRETTIADCEVITSRGCRLAVELTVFLVKDKDGRPAGFRGLVKDVTELRQFEKYRRKLEAQLQQAQKMEAIGTLAAGVAHGFNNVLMGIQGSLSLISIGLAAGKDIRRQLDRIEECVGKGIELARQILGFARASKFVVMRTDLNDIVTSTSRLFAREMPELKIHEYYQPDLWEVDVDRVQLGQALLNLFAHGAESMNRSGILCLETENVFLGAEDVKGYNKVEPGAYVRVAVTDDGPGIDEAVGRRIFEPYFHHDRLESEGVRLAAVYGIVSGHGGIIDVYSELGHGTCFTIYLPAARHDRKTRERFPEQLPGGSATILLIDDNQVDLSLARNMLVKLGYRLSLASGGREGIELFKAAKNTIDLVILDTIVPDMEVEEIYGALRKIDPAVTVLLASGYGMNPRTEALLSKGCRGLIHKPFRLYMLADTISRVLSGQA